jgi:hypothetical protein
MTPTPDALRALVAELRARGDAAYCQLITIAQQPECLGWEAKVAAGKFGAAELKAHTDKAELLGRHRALHAAADRLESLIGAGGWREIAEAPRSTLTGDRVRLLLWVDHHKRPEHAFGYVYGYEDGSFAAQAEGFAGAWDIKFWQPLPTPPGASDDR